jgi:pilus assembly protein Flp/PilA
MKKFFQDESGASAVEYGLLVALIAVVIITAVALVGTNLTAVFNKVASTLPTS